ncbi:MAG: PadR family transcriptional regulator [Planctomycetaceae bacterium]|jgi:DNA-binding PadR family transcriptional regulator|nr:PadR family transcriptional regulator [Planctomycetaceae bacterium]
MSKSKKKAIFNQCPCVGATLDKLIQPALLAILSEGPLHGYELARRIGEIPDFLNEAPDVSGVYRMLKTLESRGMVVSGWDISDKGRAKNLFTITDNGRLCLKNWYQTLQNYKKNIDSLLKTTGNAIKRSPQK